jgi:zinc transport system ATP-binding protein
MSENENKLIALENAGVMKDRKWLVRGITMSVSLGEIVTLIGPNGSGKTTTAKIALGLWNISEGIAKRKNNLRVGYVPQKLQIDWTVPINVNRFMSLTNKISNKDIEFALSLTDTRHLVREEMRELSGGELQRVMVARAIALSPQLLVLDEPVQGVDFRGEETIYNLIEETRKKINCGILLISHDLHMVMSATDKVLCLNGHICCSGTPNFVANTPEFRELFGERMAKSLAVYKHNHDHEHRIDGSIKK